ncbi:MAG: hypothetical protein M1831_006496 [Alyxoria varia]|nr:MAG: hypothetical protein M1831_006496 [Alyxoria varia]
MAKCRKARATAADWKEIVCRANNPPPPPISRLPTEILGEIISFCIPDVVRAPDMNSPHPQLGISPLARVCRKFRDITMDVLSRGKTLELQYFNHSTHSIRATRRHDDGIGPRSALFSQAGIVDYWKRVSADVPVHAIDRFQSLKVRLFYLRDYFKEVVENAKRLVDAIASGARASRGVRTLRTLELYLHGGEIVFWPPVEVAVRRFEAVLAPFRKLRGIDSVEISSAATHALSSGGFCLETKPWLEYFSTKQMDVSQEAVQDMQGSGEGVEAHDTCHWELGNE